jgi:hypothetical protein
LEADNVDLSKFSTADKLIVGGGLAYLVCMFLPWYGLAGGSNTGWDYFLGGILPLLLILISAGRILLLQLSPETKLPDLPVSWGQAHLIAGAAAAVIVLLRLIIGSDECALGFCIDLDRKFGLFLALIAAAVVAYGGFLKSKDADEAPAAGGGTAPF